MEILIRLPAKSVMRFKCVSKLWSLLISSSYFTNFFHKTRQSSRLFMYIVNNEKPSDYMFLSTSPNPDSDKSILSLDHVLDMPVLGGHFVSGIRGLLCLRTERRMQICNLTTKQLVELELFPIDDDDNVWNYFGHDHVRDEYKVLNIVWEFSNDGEKLLRSSEYQVLVLAPQASWRNTQSSFIPPPHLPCTKGISINGVLYYRAQIDRSDTFVVMSFDLTSEEFSLIKCPLDVIPRPALMNYEGKISLFDVFEYSVDIWTLEDAEKSIWSNMKSFVLTISDMDFVSWSRVWRQGTSRSGEITQCTESTSSGDGGFRVDDASGLPSAFNLHRWSFFESHKKFENLLSTEEEDLVSAMEDEVDGEEEKFPSFCRLLNCGPHKVWTPYEMFHKNGYKPGSAPPSSHLRALESTFGFDSVKSQPLDLLLHPAALVSQALIYV
ncbi:hypothetical protein F2Q69_00034167 [Brassica cretica]|uniref:F-box domain-containing protein n=1 Tax=Brassica cretica TaxID=69181 RepID=A0A8S9STV0_BRACR|nr:hypothetical protein F2Q69_00034167 [Brassica cretica]